MADVKRNRDDVPDAPDSIDADGNVYDPSDINAFVNPAVGSNPDGVDYPPTKPFDEAETGEYIELDELSDDELEAEAEAHGVDPDAPREEVVEEIVEADKPKPKKK